MRRSTLVATTGASVTLLGPEVEHRDSLDEMLGGWTSRLNWLPDSVSFREGRGGETQGRFARLVDQLAGTRDPAYHDFVVKALDDSGTQLIIAYWGTLPLADLAAIKKALPNIIIALMVLCYPLSFNALGITRQNFFMRRASRFLDAFLCPSQEMISYLGDRVIANQKVSAFMLPPCWPASFQSATLPQPPRTVPNIIYVGRTDLSGATIHKGDDNRRLLRELLESGIEVHHVHSPETDDGHPLRRPFRPLPLAGLVEFMGGFDASLVAYNTAACARKDRFQLTVPDRVITSAAAGVPIAVPKQGYSATKSYLNGYPALIEFESADDLSQTLADRQRISSLRSAAWSARSNYAAERHAESLQMFLAELFRH